MPPYVPPEIIDIILGHADDELLCTCALVCHVWLETSRRHLFQRIALVRATAYDSFIRQIVHCRRMAPWLKLARILFYSEESVNQTRGNRIFLELAGQLPNLSSLILDSLDFTKSLHLRAHHGLSRFTYVRELWLQTCVFPSLATLRRCCAALPNLRNLCLSEIVLTASTSSEIILDHFYARPALDTLSIEIDPEYSNAVSQWLSHTPTAYSLRRFMVTSSQLQYYWDEFGSTTTCMDIILSSTQGELQLDVPRAFSSWLIIYRHLLPTIFHAAAICHHQRR